ncbi:hypothetical protein PG989_015375 [Apiospora arundinis]
MHLEISFSKAAPYGAAFSILYLFLVICYRLWFHPLRRYPGPFSAKLCDLYGAFHAYKTRLHETTLQDHEQYGPVIRQGPNKLVFNTVGALHDIYRDAKFTKSRTYLISQRHPGVYGLFNSVDQELHQSKRKLVARRYSPKEVHAFEPTMIDQIDIFIKQLAESCRNPDHGPVNMTKQAKYLAIDMMGHFLFGYPLKLQTESTHRVMASSKANFFFNVGAQLPFLVDVGVLRAVQYLWSRMSSKNYIQALDKIITNRLSQGPKVKEELLFMSAKSRISADDTEWLRDIRTEAVWHMLAGSDTISTTVSALFFYLAQNEDCYQRLAHEVRSTFPQETEIRGGALLSSCTYLRACLDETLRMSPSIPGTLWREEVNNRSDTTEPLVVDGHVVPPGVQVGVNTYALLHNEQYFPDAFNFKPARWLEESGPGQSNKQAFAPFSIGNRSCLGKSMAYLEASIIVAKTLWHFDFHMSAAEQQDVPPPCSQGGSQRFRNRASFPMKDTFSAMHDGPFLRFEFRDAGVGLGR